MKQHTGEAWSTPLILCIKSVVRSTHTITYIAYYIKRRVLLFHKHRSNCLLSRYIIYIFVATRTDTAHSQERILLPIYSYLSSLFNWCWAPFHKRFFHRNSNSMEISFHSHHYYNTVIATNFEHGTTAVLSWHVQTFWRSYGQQRNYSKAKFSSYLNCVSETGPRAIIQPFERRWRTPKNMTQYIW